MAMTLLGPMVLYLNHASHLLVGFWIYPAMLLSGMHDSENTLRHASLVCMCIMVTSGLAWNNFHPKPISHRRAGQAALWSSVFQTICLLWAFGLGPFEGGLPFISSSALAMILQLLSELPRIFVIQVGTAFVVSSNRSPVRYQILAWISVMLASVALTQLPSLREQRLLIVSIGVLPRLLIVLMFWIHCSPSQDATPEAMSKLSSSGGQSEKKKGENENQDQDSGEEFDESLTVSLSRTGRFALHAANGTLGEALNDMATDLATRSALAQGDTKLLLAYNVAVASSMALGYLSEVWASSSKARAGFAVLWGLAQGFRGGFMHLLAPDRLWILFIFVFLDKFSGPLGQAAVDTALLTLIRRNGGGKPATSSSYRLPANGVWTLRTTLERLERPMCQLILLTFHVSSAPGWLPGLLASTSVLFVLHTLVWTDDSLDSPEASHVKAE